MPSYLSQIFVNPSKRTSNPTQRHLPMLNELSTNFNSYLSHTGQLSKKKALMNWFKSTGELSAFINKIATDMTSQYHFEPINTNQSGRNKVMKANLFAQEIVLSQTLEAHAADCLVTGEGFGWIGKFTNKQLEQAVVNAVSKRKYLGKVEKKELISKLSNELKFEDGIPTNVLDEDILRPRKYRYMASSTVEIVYNEYDVSAYNQKVHNMQGTKFTPKEIIHYTLQKRDGKINGFTPVEGIIVQLELLRLMWQNLLSMHKNGGSPDKLFILGNTRVNSPEYARIEQQLQKYKLVENKHGNMVFTGDVKVEDLQQLDEMQFKDSGLYITGLIAMQWGIPRSSIPYIIGGANTKDDTGGNSERGYWEVVRNFQKNFSDIMNTQLWIPYFGVRLVLDNSYFQLDVQREAALMSRLNNVQQMNTILAQNKKQLNESKVKRLLELSDEDLEDREEEILDPMMGNTMNQQPSKSEVDDSDSKKNIKKKKATEQQNTMTSAGKPTGVGKEWTSNTIREWKTLVGEDSQLVDLRTFVKLYNEDKAYAPGKPPRLFRRSNVDYTVFKFKSSDFVYKTIIKTEDMDRNQITIMNMGMEIYDL